MKFRSLIVGAKHNGRSSFGLGSKQKSPGSPSTFHFNSWWNSVFLGCDVDGNCIYEREDDFLDWVVANQFDEIILTGVEDILQYGSKNAESIGTASGRPFPNSMGEIQRFDWHLARFIYKAKSEYGIRVVATLNRDPDQDDLDEFYEFHIDYSRSAFAEVIADLSEVFFSRYTNLWLNNPDSVDYIGYGEDTLFFPLDSAGRMSDIDKFITDSYNFLVYEHRVANNYIAQAESDCTELPDETNTCLMAFDAHIIEWEWWARQGITNQDGEFNELVTLLENLKDRAGEYWYNCSQEFYVYQDDWGDNTADRQNKANELDQLADRIYMYSYHKNPCDCFNGTQSSSKNKFYNKAGLLANNGYGADNGKTILLPVFSGKFYDASTFNAPPPEEWNDGKRGCVDGDDPNSTIDVSECDYCQDYSGRAMNDLYNAGYGREFGYIENVFQDQYDLSGLNWDHTVLGYGWFKYSVLRNNNFISSVQEESAFKKFKIYPNPASDAINIIMNHSNSRVNYRIVGLNGAVVRRGSINGIQHQSTIRVDGLKGVYIIELEDVESRKVYGTKRVVIL